LIQHLERVVVHSFNALVCFVYDPDHLLQNPAAIEADLSVVRDGLAVQVVVCPRGS
jgi:hypothetical protein